MRYSVSPRLIARAFADALDGADQATLPRAVTACARWLAREHLLHRGPQILALLDEELLSRQGRTRARVASAGPLADAAQRRVERILTRTLGESVRARATINPDLIAGIRVQVDEVLIDASVRGALAGLRTRLRVAIARRAGLPDSRLQISHHA
ncbi:MAG: F0F1 ATP synthase subunit delta [bacterium]|nr:F0F1 ATP synthase subunit delta [bacterium]